jgi:hypothetical protein
LRAHHIQCDAHSQSDLHKMATVQRNVQCVMWPAKFESVTQVRPEYKRVFNEEPLCENNIRRWDRQLKETGSLPDKQCSGAIGVVFYSNSCLICIIFRLIHIYFETPP